MAIAGLGFAIGLIVMLLLTPAWSLWFTVIIPGYFTAIGFSFAALLVSNTTTQRSQGEALGVNQSLLVFSEAIVGLLGGFLIAMWLYLPFIIGILSSLFSMLWMLNLVKSQKLS